MSASPPRIGRMPWLLRYRIREYLATSLWLDPVALLVLALVAGPLVQRLDERTAWSFYAIGPQGARALVAALVGATFSLVVFVFSMLHLAVPGGGQPPMPAGAAS